MSMIEAAKTRGMSKNKKPLNRLYAHLKENKGHKINWDGFVYLDSEKNWKRRKIKKAIYINAVNPTEAMGSNNILNLEKGYDLNAIWSGLHEDYRSLRKATLSAETLEKCFVTELNIVDFIIQTTYIYSFKYVY